MVFSHHHGGAAGRVAQVDLALSHAPSLPFALRRTLRPPLRPHAPCARTGGLLRSHDDPGCDPGRGGPCDAHPVREPVRPRRPRPRASSRCSSAASAAGPERSPADTAGAATSLAELAHPLPRRAPSSAQVRSRRREDPQCPRGRARPEGAASGTEPPTIAGEYEFIPLSANTDLVAETLRPPTHSIPSPPAPAA